MTKQQMNKLRLVLHDLDAISHGKLKEFHHGCCVGADEQAVLTVACLFQDCDIHSHPGDDSSFYFSWEAWGMSDIKHNRKHNLDRNKDIVNVCNVLVAAPEGPEERRSGTWSTIRYARRKGKMTRKRVIIINPAGEVEDLR